MRLKNAIHVTVCALLLSCSASARQIDRHALVTRHNVHIARFDSLASLSVGNGEFAFTVDPTGLQTFPDYYEKGGVPLGTQSQWGWHSFSNPNGYTKSDVWKYYTMHNRQVPYLYAHNAPGRQKEATDWLRANPHRLHLGMLGFTILLKNGAPAKMEDIQHIRQELDLWAGEIRSYFEVEGAPVTVRTVCHPLQDMIAVSVQSPLLAQQRLSLRIRFPYPTGDWEGLNDWRQPGKHRTQLRRTNAQQALFERTLDSTRYYALLQWSDGPSLQEKGPHEFLLQPAGKGNTLTFSCYFSEEAPGGGPLPAFATVQQQSSAAWRGYWQSGGAVDLSGSTDPRAKELERRIVLSQYLTRIQCAGSVPPQETGLTYNSWYGKFHLEMHWWHAAHFALWNRSALLEKSLPWYAAIMPKARETAAFQGFRGARWPKMTDPSGNDSPSPIAPFLIWQQPHFIYMAELCYRNGQQKDILEKYKDQVFASAEFMAAYPWYDSARQRYVLGPGLIPAQERFDAATTINPGFELAYWRWALDIAQQWRRRLGLAPQPEWDKVRQALSPYASKDGLYLAAESAPDSYSNHRYMTDHPAILGMDGFLPPSPELDTAMMLRTFRKIWNVWHWEETWGWDYPLVAMAATRLGQPEAAVDILLRPVTKNTYLPNGHNYQRDNLRIYLPGNGALLSAVALMCAGWDGYQGPDAPGFPKNGKWKVKWEGLSRMP